jgi:FHS family glucose/mannose:H+ symporter-like MFS transporter
MVRAAARTGRALMTGTRSERTGPLDAIAFAGMFVFGIVMALLGAVMPVVSSRLSLGLGDVGTLFLVTNASMLAASLLIGPAIDRFGMKAPLALGSVLVAVALVSIATASQFANLLAAVVALGFGGGALNASTNTLVADLHDDPEKKAAALNLLGVFFGFGALMLPFTIGALLSRAGFGGVMTATAGLCAATGLLALVLRFPAPKQARGWPLTDMRRFIRMPLVLTLAFLLFFQSGNEFLLGGYFATFLTQELTVPVERASYLLAAYWAAIMVSRLLLSRVLLRLGPDRIVLGSALAAAAGALIVGSADSTSVALTGILITGMALAGIFPTVLGVAGAAFRDHSGTVFGILFTVALTGGMTMPWLAGHLAASTGLRNVFLLAAGNFVMIAGLSGLSRRAQARA